MRAPAVLVTAETGQQDIFDERYNTVGPRLAARAVIQQKVKREQPMAQGGHPQGPPLRLSSPRIDHILRRNWSTRVRSFSKCTGNPWQHGFCNFGMQGCHSVAAEQSALCSHLSSAMQASQSHCHQVPSATRKGGLCLLIFESVACSNCQPRAVALSQGWFLSPGNICQFLKTVLVVIT